MDIEKIKEFAKRRNEIIGKKLNLNSKELVLAHAVKLGEEAGELNEEVLNFLNYQMRDKMKGENNAEHELADVILVVSILAESMNMDIEKGLEEKMKIIEETYN
jgi:NTP pyrophosphatase (non-canonical NTP hydrolase)